MVPNGWKQTTLDKVLTIGGGKDYKHLEEGSIPVYGSGGYMLSVSDYLYDGESVCIGRKGTIDKPIFLKGKFWTVDTLFYTHSFKDSEPYYIYQFFQTVPWRRLNEASGVPSLSKSIINKVKINLPPLPEQLKIAKILSTWDKAISTTECLIDNSKQQKKALMQQLLTGKKRLLDDSGKAFEGEWEEVKLSNVAEVVMGSSPKSASYNDNSEGLPLIQGNADIKNRKSVPRTYTSEVTKKCRIGDILLSVRAPVGTVAKSEHNACIGRGISAISAKKHHVQEYLYQWLLWFEPRWEKYSQGSTFEAVNSNDIKSLHLAIPEHSEQVKIASALSNADQEIELLEQQLADLKQEKKALMQQLLTGKRRVIVDEKEVA
ncbi:MAG TPA: restriction endonuclease subunit S [Pseudoalteromonas sp.]|nr:restriction endonuclease subunit S [Pseudoalteromonas sp.]|tara:strand:+ start:6245 stop:7369 length:1125 start_codon:yes stop_codon:yes gene_type:complete